MDSALFWLAYMVIGLLIYRRAYPVMADRVLEAEDGIERGAAAALTMLACFVWPLVVVGYGVWRFATPVTPSERKAELDERERRIAALEREAGLR